MSPFPFQVLVTRYRCDDCGAICETLDEAEECAQIGRYMRGFRRVLYEPAFERSLVAFVAEARDDYTGALAEVWAGR